MVVLLGKYEICPYKVITPSEDLATLEGERQFRRIGLCRICVLQHPQKNGWQ